MVSGSSEQPHEKRRANMNPADCIERSYLLLGAVAHDRYTGMLILIDIRADHTPCHRADIASADQVPVAILATRLWRLHCDGTGFESRVIGIIGTSAGNSRILDCYSRRTYRIWYKVSHQ